MMDFMVLAYPRSGTTWLANLLCTDDTLCLHDPLTDHSPAELDAMQPAPYWGISCTGSWLDADWCNSKPVRRLVIERPFEESNAAVVEMGFPAMPKSFAVLDRIEGERISFADLWTESGCRSAWEYLLPHKPWNAARWRELKAMSVQPHFAALNPRRDVIEAMLKRIRSV